MILKVTTRHAICAVTYLAAKGPKAVVTAEEISRNRGIPMSYLRRVLSKLAARGIIRSFHGGREKGYSVAENLASISVYDLFDVFENWTKKGSLLAPTKKPCHCKVDQCWAPIEEMMFAPLKKVTLDVICGRNPGKALKRMAGR